MSKNHMTNSELLQIRKLLSNGVTKVEDIQDALRTGLSALRIKQVIRASASVPVKPSTKKPTAAERAKAKAAAKVDPLS